MAKAADAKARAEAKLAATEEPTEENMEKTIGEVENVVVNTIFDCLPLEILYDELFPYLLVSDFTLFIACSKSLTKSFDIPLHDLHFSDYACATHECFFATFSMGITNIKTLNTTQECEDCGDKTVCCQVEEHKCENCNKVLCENCLDMCDCDGGTYCFSGCGKTYDYTRCSGCQEQICFRCDDGDCYFCEYCEGHFCYRCVGTTNPLCQLKIAECHVEGCEIQHCINIASCQNAEGVENPCPGRLENRFLTLHDLEAMTVPALKLVCKQEKLKVGGNKGDLIQRIEENRRENKKIYYDFLAERDEIWLSAECRDQKLLSEGSKQSILKRLKEYADEPFYWCDFTLSELKGACARRGLTTRGSEEKLLTSLIEHGG